ncbi:MAG: DUF6531 domain-containing protein, partial [Anaerolineae bacterium]|nr:DUF6531 domain-containing protein [Anaerolineae bacterium]
IVATWAQTVSVLGGNLSVTGTANGQTRLYYLENFGPDKTLTEDAQSNLRDITDSNDTRIATDWQNITGIWVMTDCMGYRLADGGTFTVPVNDQQAKRLFIVQGHPDPTNVGCAEFYVRMDALDSTGSTVRQNLCFTWEPVRPNSEITMNQGVFHALLVNDRVITLQSNEMSILPYTGAGASPEAPLLPLDIALKVDNQNVTIRLDWVNLKEFSYVEQPDTGREIRFVFLDTPRTTTTRPGNNLLSLDALQDVIHIIYRGVDRQNSANGKELLFLPARDSYLEIETPAGDPTFDGASFDGKSLPGEPGYQPRGLNNLGGECYPVNTALDLNCAPNGDINPANGNLWYAVTDLVAYSPVADLALARSYNSYNYDVDGPFGLGWSSPFPVDYAIAFDETTNSRYVPPAGISYPVGIDLTWAPRGIVTFMTASGSLHTFVRDTTATGFSGEVFRAVTMPGWVLSRSGADRVQQILSDWTLATDSGLTYVFDRAGRLHSYGYPAQGYQVTIKYPWDRNYYGPGALTGQAVEITDDLSRRKLEITYDQNAHIVLSRLWDMTVPHPDAMVCRIDESCFEVSYSYDGNYLTAVKYPDGQTATYTYEEGRLQSHNDPRAPIAPVMSYKYGQGGAVATASIERPGAEALLWRQIEATISNDQRVVVVTDEHGNQVTHTYQLDSGTLTAAEDSYTQIQTTSPLAAAGGFEARPTDFDWQNGLLTTIQQRYVVGTSNNGRNTINFDYTATGRLIGLNGGYPGMKATQLSEPSSSLVRSALPGSLDFATGTSQLTYSYNAVGFVTGYTDANGASYTIDRDNLNRPVVMTRNQDGVTWGYTYDNSSAWGPLRSVKQQTTTLPDDPGYTVTYTWDGLGRLVEINDSVLGTYRIAYQWEQGADGIYRSEVTVTDPRNAATVSRFDERSRLIETILTPPGSDNYLERTTYEYASDDPFGRVSAMLRWLEPDAPPLRTTYDYDDRIDTLDVDGSPVPIGGTRVTITDPYGRSQYAVYDALGRVRETGDTSMQRRSQYDYLVDNTRNINGLRIAQRDYLANQEIAETQYVFDFGWQLTGVTRREFNPFATTPGSWSGEWQVLSSSVSTISQNVRRLQSPLIGLDDIVWEDPNTPYVNGRPQQVRRNSGVPGNSNLTVKYDFLGRPVEVTQPAATGSHTTYLTYCPLTSGQYQVLRSQPGDRSAMSCQNPDSAALAVTYDAHDRILSIQDEYGARTFDYAVDYATGEHKVTLTSSAYTWNFAYDAAGRMTRWQDDTGTVRDYRYDPAGRLTGVTVADQPEASFTLSYNAADLITQRRDGIGRGYAYDYNDRGQLVLQQNLLTRDTTSYTYTELGLLNSVISPLGRVTTYEYDDPVDPTRLTAVITAAGRSQYTWNNDQNTVTYTDGRGKQVIYTFDALGALWQIASPEGRTEQLNYDGAGFLTAWGTVENGISHRLNMGYNPDVNRIDLSAEGVANWNWQFSLTPTGQLAGVTNPANQTLAFSYDSLGRLAALAASDQIQWVISRTQDAKVLQMNDGLSGEVRTMSFDSLYRLIGEQNNNATTTYNYQPDPLTGVVNLGITGADGIRVYTFSPGDNRHTPAVVIHSPGQRIAYNYDAEGQLAGITRLVCSSSTDGDFAQDLSAFSLEDPDVCADQDTEGWWSWAAGVSFGYDALGKPIRFVNEEQNVETFSYDRVGNLIGYQDADGKTYIYEYDGLNRLIRLTSPGGIDLLLRYDLDGVAGICQARAENHLDYAACSSQGGQLETYTYDGLGRLLSQQFPNIAPDQSASVNWTYGPTGAGAATGRGNLTLNYTADGLALLNGVGNQSIQYHNFDQIKAASNVVLDYDSYGRLEHLQTGGRQLDYTYTDNGQGYTITDRASGASLVFQVAANGLLESVDYQAGSSIESIPMLRVDQFGQLENGDTFFEIAWADDYATDFTMNRQGDETHIIYIQPQLSSEIYTDYVSAPTGLVQRQVISGYASGFFEATSTPTIPNTTSVPNDESTKGYGYISVLGYDRNNQLLSLRIGELNSIRLLYQETFVYTDFGQIKSEVRQYQDGTQVRIEYTYNVRNQLTGRTVSVNPSDQSTVASSVALLLVAGVLYGAGRRAGLRRLAGIGLVVIILGIGYPTIVMNAQEQTLTQVSYTYDYDSQGNLSQIKADGKTCADYSYDEANHLASATIAGHSASYQYDIFNRVILAGDTQFAYTGGTTPFIMDNGQPTYQVESISGQQLFMAAGKEITPYIYGGEGQVLGIRPYDASENGAAPQHVWVFDPLGRFVTFDPPTKTDNPCQLLTPPQPDVRQGFLVVWSNKLWDVANNQFFAPDGRVYMPELGRFLQRRPIGPDAQGSVYDFTTSLAAPPIEYRSLPAQTGLEQLN